MVDADGADARERLAELRRRLYRPDVTAADVERFTRLRDRLDALPQPAPLPPPAASAAEQTEQTERTEQVPQVEQAQRSEQRAPEAPPSAPPPTRHRPLAIAGTLTAVAALVGAIVVLQQPPADSTATVAQPTAASTEGTSRQGGSQQLSERFNGDAATPVGMTVEVSVDGSRVLAQRFSGSGPAEVPLITGGAPLDGGRLTVTLRSTDRQDVSWQTEPEAGQPPSTVTGTPDTPTTGRSSGASGGSTTVMYGGAPPSRITVLAPTGTGWTLVVAFSR